MARHIRVTVSLTVAMCARPRALLDEAGWTVGDDGMRRNAARCRPLKVEFLNGQPQLSTGCLTRIIENLRKAIGIDAVMTSCRQCVRWNRPVPVAHKLA